MNALVLAVEIGADQLVLAVARRDHEDAVAIGAELRLGAIVGDPDGGAPGRCDAVDAGVVAPAL